MPISCSYDMSYVITNDMWKSELWAYNGNRRNPKKTRDKHG